MKLFMNGIFKKGFKWLVSRRAVLAGLEKKIDDCLSLNKNVKIIRIQARVLWQSSLLKLLTFLMTHGSSGFTERMPPFLLAFR
ncbi:hypothetical protein [Paenibacillus sp. HB172176]|uniref:hypothetical protein n=1 Tax=Paenibacillus sp. HB172176 TaxID=2493690 RepID=UPI00143C7B95|nr:hypothetical protein [Paenibacillus sp. HB172176]